MKALIGGLALVVVWVFWWRFDLASDPVTSLRDDAYYYLCFARSLAEGHGPCVSDGIATSGVHWLWPSLLALVHSLLPGGDLVLQARGLGLALHAVTALWLARAIRGRVGELVALLYLGNPFLVHEAQNGQDTALACLALLALVLSLARGSRTLTGASVLTILARSDLAFVILALSIAREGWRARALIAPGVAVLVLVFVNVLAAGHPLQDSSAPLSWLFWQRFLAGDPGVREWLHHLWWQLRPCLLGSPWATVSPICGGLVAWAALHERIPPRARVIPLLLVGVGYALGARDWLPALVAACLLALPIRSLGEPRAVPLALGLGAMTLAHFVVRLHAPPYYFAPFGIAGAFALAALLRAHVQVGLVIVVLSAAWNVWRAPVPAERFAWQVEMRMAACSLDRLVPRGERIGCFNSGLMTFDRPRDIVNLDGLVNRAAFTALRAGALNEYLDREGIRFLIDYPAMFGLDRRNPHASGRYFDHGRAPELEEIARADVRDVDGGWPGADSFRLYWRVGRGTKPTPPVQVGLTGYRNPLGLHDPMFVWLGRGGVSLEGRSSTGAVPPRKLCDGIDGVTFIVPLLDADEVWESGATQPLPFWPR